MPKFETAFKVTDWFETGGESFTLVSGDFDKQGLSWGPRQNCIGQGSLQTLMRHMLEMDQSNVATALGPLLPQFQDICKDAPTTQQLALVRGNVLDQKGNVKPEWVEAFKRLGSLPSVQQVFLDDAKQSAESVDKLAQWIASGPKPTLREWCLAYDVVTQQGGVNTAFQVLCSSFLLALSPFQKDSRDRMRAICWLRAGWSYIRGNRPWALDALSRKLLIVEGVGKFRGALVDLDKQFGISDNEAV